MRVRSILYTAAVSVFLSVAAFGSTAGQLAEQAVSEDYQSAMSAIRELRTMGPTGLDALFVRYAAEIEHFGKIGDATYEWKRIANAIDTVAMQKDAYASHLYWYTDLDAAKAAAAKQKKPILTLRLLGNLNEEFSCANSRLFRSILYPNAEISKYLRENYILHWKSVRPAPRITIDFGDGRKIERTITGNSIHYVLSSDGRVIDALPGLYSPVAFNKYIKQGKEVNDAMRSLPSDRRDLALMKYRKAAYDQIIEKRTNFFAAANVKLAETPVALPAPDQPISLTISPSAILAAPVATAKMVVVDEYSILQVYDDFAKFEANINFGDWEKLARLYSPNVTPDAASIAFIRRQNAKTGLSEAEFKGLFAKLDKFIALDTTRNDFLYHAKLYEWLNQSYRGAVNLDALNSRVYDQMFLTPDYDKWLGLYSSDVYTALDGNGIIK